MSGHIVLESSKVTILVIIFLAQALKEMGIPSLGLSHSLLLYAGYLFSSGNPYFGGLIIIFTFLGSFCGAFLVFYLSRWRGDQLLAGMVHYGVIKPESYFTSKTSPDHFLFTDDLHWAFYTRFDGTNVHSCWNP